MKKQDDLETADLLAIAHLQDAPGYKEVFPELAESEDERIRKELIDKINNLACSGFMLQRQKQNFITYLEKQKELFKSGRGLYYYDGEKTTYCGYPATEENPYDFAMSQQEVKQKEQNGGIEECTDFIIYHPLKNGKGEYECIPYSFYGSLTSFSEDKDLVDFLRTCFYTKEECNEWIERQKEQKSAEWSKEDERMLLSIINAFRNGTVSTIGQEQWLKSLPERFNLQPKQEWSEEDKNRIQRICDFLWKNRKGDTDTIYQIEKDADWLKSLRPDCYKNCNSRWKPSEEQMKALKYAAYHMLPGEEYRDVLFSLLKDLTKLM